RDGDLRRHRGKRLLCRLRAQAPVVGPLGPGHPAALVWLELARHPKAVGGGSRVDQRAHHHHPIILLRQSFGPLSGPKDCRTPPGGYSRDMEEIRLIVATGPPDSPARTRPPTREPFRIAAVQQRWHADPDEHEAALAAGIKLAAGEGARLVCLQELTLSRYFAIDPAGPEAAGAEPEELPGGRSHRFATRMAAETGIHVHASLYERADGEDGLGFNTAIVVAPDGELLARTRKLHIPVTAGYHEDRYFRPGPADTDAFPVLALGEARLGLPTCWDQWFPEVARAYGLAGAEVLVYPTAIGSEPDHPEFDTEPLWQRVIVANGIANGTFMVAVN